MSPSKSSSSSRLGATVLVVCEGNVCRSPFAAAVVRNGLLARGADDIAVVSAGTRARVGEKADATTSAVAARIGVTLDDHVARQLDRRMMADADLVLTATRSLRSEVATLHPRALAYTFTIRQLGRILSEVESDLDELEDLGPVLPRVTSVARVRALVALARRARGQHFVPDPASEDVVDPRGRSTRFHQAAAEQIVPAAERLVDVLCDGLAQPQSAYRADASG